MHATANQPKVLILASEACAYPGANAVGQALGEIAAAIYSLPIR